ncbi:aspartate aminotransferase [Gloeomargarita lithophora Alchichica-D10]|uniref:Aminotransferase n=1 Tax=Gloeomargarita lithophora Alchichica-D10 TaxID=1188229 RepID=A0A1J0ACQ1_9CYAN|nr:pyridoxal phosphate-dependent aminotransferase [Gloeomargarita lithophora]APB33714.1 aspartate aminotransferase [Gloeomargarita lithophora Alchichica-D10]
MLSERILQIQPSATLEITARAQAMRAAGLDVCSFAAGEPDFDTPAFIREAVKTALDQGKTRYGPAAGEPVLRKAIAQKLHQDNGLTYEPEQVFVTNGCKQALYNLVQVMIQPGDEVLIPAPYWVSYPEMVRLAGGVPVLVTTSRETDYKITPTQLAQAVTPRTRLLMLNSPNNPTGVVYCREELLALAQEILRHDLWVIADEIYEKLVYDGMEHISIAALGREIYDRTLVCNGFAKAYAMTGWRVGYGAGPQAIITAAANLQGHSTSNVCTFAQHGALAALQGPQEELHRMRQVFSERRRVMVDWLQTMPGLGLVPPAGAFYIWVDMRATGLTSTQFCQQVLEQYQVALVPGRAFGDDQHVRLSYATDLATIEKGMARLAAYVGNLAPLSVGEGKR